MEKYRSTADPSTGIHPFLPPKRPRSNPIVTLITTPFLLLLRLPILIITLILYVPLITIIPNALRPIPKLSYLSRRLLDSLFLTPILFSFSVWNIQPPIMDKPRTRLSSSNNNNNNNKLATPQPGDIIIVNHASPLDILYLKKFYSPVFVTPSSLESCKKRMPFENIIPLSFYFTLSRVSCAPPTPPNPSTSTLHKLFSPSATHISHPNVPVVLLAEGCTTNGKGVLKFPLNAQFPGPPIRLFALGLNYSPNLQETRPIGNLLSNIIYFLTRLQSHIHARIIRVSNDSNVQQTIANLANIPPLSITRDVGVEFYKHYQQQQQQQ